MPPVLLWLAAAGVWLDVPYVHQAKDGCGAAAIAMVMRYWKGEADPARIQESIYSPEAHGAPASALGSYFRARGFTTVVFRGEWSDLEQHLSAGRPLIAALKEGRGAHFVVVTGIDSSRNQVLMNDPARGKLTALSRPEFERKWKDGWTLLAVPGKR